MLGLLPGLRDKGFVIDYGWLLTRERLFAEVPDLAEDEGVQAGPEFLAFIVILGGHARLAMTVDQEALADRVRVREGSPHWITDAKIGSHLRTAIATREPFPWVRLGDGEARFIL